MYSKVRKKTKKLLISSIFLVVPFCFDFPFFYKMKNQKDFATRGLEILGQRLRQLRKQKGYNNYETFAYDHNIARAQYGRYEKGTADLRFGTLLKIIEAHDMTIQEFFSEGFTEEENDE